MHINKLALAKSSMKRKTCHTADFGRVWPEKWYPWLAIGWSCHAADNCQMWQKQWCPLSDDFVLLRTLTKCGPKCAPYWRTLSRSGLQPNVAQNVPLVGGLCHTVDFDQMWPKMCPWLEDFVADFNQMWPKMCPSSEEFVMHKTLTKWGPKCAPCRRTLSCSGLWPNVAQNVPLVRAEDFVTQRTSTKCGPNMCPLTGDFILLWGLTTYGSTTYSSSKKASTKQTDSNCWSTQN